MARLDGRIAEQALAIGIDVGGTNTSLVVTDQDDRLLLHDVMPTDTGNLGRQIVASATDAARRLAAEGHAPLAVGVAVPGHVDPLDGTFRLAVNLRGPALPVAALVEESVGLPCVVEHDARAAASWLRDRTSGGSRYLAYLSIGTGISAGVVLDGVLLRGAAGLAGEIGHAVAEPAGRECACGLRGCLETVAAGPAIERLAREVVAAGRTTALSPDASAADVFGAAANGDQVALGIVDVVTAHLARAVRALVLGFGVDRVVIGGGVSAGGPLLLERLQRHITNERRASALVEAAFSTATIELLPPEMEAGARGAAAVARASARAGRAQREGVGSQ